MIGDDTSRAECRVWNVGKAAASVERPVRSRIPTLLTVGTLDPVHPRASSEAIAKYLRNSTIVEVPGTGHGAAFAGECPTATVHAFLTDPTAGLDTGCVQSMRPPAFT